MWIACVGDVLVNLNSLEAIEVRYDDATQTCGVYGISQDNEYLLDDGITDAQIDKYLDWLKNLLSAHNSGEEVDWAINN